MATAHVLIADITGSTNLYETLPDREAMMQINIVLARMRTIIEEHSGQCVKSTGDDTLSVFEDAEQVFSAARAMIETKWTGGLAVHAGAYWGEVIRGDQQAYGDAINTTARLSALAKPGEVLVGDTTFEALSEKNRALFVSMGGLKLKGKSVPVCVHSFAVGDLGTQTVLSGRKDTLNGPRTAAVDLQAMTGAWHLCEGQSMMVGRSTECEMQLDHPWVSRKHGTFELRAAQLEYTDHSSSGSIVITSDGQEILLQRRSMLLTGTGQVLVGTRDRTLDSSAIRFATNDLGPV